MPHVTAALAHPRRTGTLIALALSFASAPAVLHAQVTVSSSTNALGARDVFRLQFGGGNVASANGSFGGLRREINWDGVPATFATPNNLPANFFNTTSPRGVVLSTPGSGFQVSAAAGDPSGAAPNFGNINASYSGIFSPFSAQRLFTPIGSNITDVTFFVAGTSTQGLTRGFGSIFSDVDQTGTTTIEYFDASDVSLGSYYVPGIVGSRVPTFSFLGVAFATPVVSRVRITTGNIALGSTTLDSDGQPNDLVVMDDFLYGEVVAAQVVPEPATLTLLALGLGAVGFAVRRRTP